MIRFFDVLFSLIATIVLFPFFLLIALAIKLTSKGPIFYKQVRVGKDNKDFKLYKFRSMRTGADKGSLLTVGGRDNRITPIGYYIRKFKLDELPQVINVLKGEMSVVGPRPEVRRYVDMYNAEQQKVLNVPPGITDYASIEFRNENELLAKADDPEQYYIDVVMPAKIELNYKFINNATFGEYVKIIALTAKGIVVK